MNKHTHGQWIKEETGCDSAADMPQAFDISNGITLVATVYCTSNNESHDCADANARLIAAAPDLLAALEGCINDLEFRANYDESNRLPKAHGQDNFWMRKHIDGTRVVASEARAAIAKAKGEPAAQDHAPAGCCAMGLCGPEAAAARAAEGAPLLTEESRQRAILENDNARLRDALIYYASPEAQAHGYDNGAFARAALAQNGEGAA